MRLTVTSIAATLSLCAISNLALGQSVEPQLEAPEPDITTFDAGESYTTTFDTKNDIDIRILDGGVLVNGVGYTMYNNASISVVGNSAKFDNRGTLNNGGNLFVNGELNNYTYLSNNYDGTLDNNGTLDNYGFLDNFGTPDQ